MAQVNVIIAGRNYRMACDDGEEPHLEQLAAQLDAKIGELRGHFGEIGDQRMTVMAALTIADDLSAAIAKIATLETRVAALEHGDASADARHEAANATVAASLEALAQRVSRIARTLDGLGRD
jgi:cell division protein ZapA